MARPKAKVLYEIRRNQKIYEVLETNSIWIILYKDKPINISVQNDPLFSIDERAQIPVKYLRTIYHNEAHALRRVEQLKYSYSLDNITVKRIDFENNINTIDHNRMA
jgi:hypothetical protein